ncbi:unnamed protein product [Bursaphelenchus xylophilus]|uniref:(pine wood nematode) hypothetical protein n=1 Tax=Bursaphelenchus xylophilus TaxID=6326 RepID=A0A1I7SLJ3_BURXY|nr:unnamed protein product [Bursaphelenchus xylophilus]CAG9129637.1 unnamed protein product [Bursaphelenchus xylophilus]
MAEVLKHRFRWFILAIGMVCFMSLASNASVFNMVVVCMASDSNTTILETFPSLDYTQYEITQTNWALGLGTALATIPFSEVYSRYGAKYPFFGACILSALATALLPFGAENNFVWLLLCRVCQGIAFAADFASVGLLCSKWSTLKQSGLFISLITIYGPLSGGFTNVLSGIVCDTTYGWPMVYHLHAVVGIVAALLWLVFYEDNPAVSRRVSPRELEKIQRGRAEKELDFGEPAPYMLLLKDPIIWSIWFSGAMEVFSTNFLSVYAPLYIRYALGYTVEFTGYYSGISRSMQIPTRLLVGFFGDEVVCLSEKSRVIMYNTIALIGGGISILLVPLTSYTTPFMAIVFISMVNLTTGVCSCGYWQSAILYSRQHSHFVMAVILFFKCVNLFLGPLLVAILVPTMDHKGQWASIFIGVGILMVIAGLVFVKYSEVEPAKYLEKSEKVTVQFPEEDDQTVKGEQLKVSSV